ncbi:arylsulfatase [Planctomycetota bacterium]
MAQITRRRFIGRLTAGASALALQGCMNSIDHLSEEPVARKPNIIYILADDLGYAELGCYGQKKIRTPHLDQIAAEGMRFTQHYSGSPVCAPSRCVLLTGKHTGHSYIRSNYEMGGWGPDEPEGQLHIPADTVTLSKLLQTAGYTTGAMGKWGLGGPDTSGEPNRQGFDHWYGYLCQRVAHNYYPTHLWRNTEKDILANEYFGAHQKLPEDRDPHDKASYFEYSGEQYSVDLMVDEALEFIKTNKDNPFFLYLPFPVPHVALQVPEDSLAEYEGTFPETPYKGEKSYLPHRAPRAAYAAMITRMDKHIGRIMDLVKELGLDDNTLVMFSSDNGPTFNGGTDSAFFESAGPLRGLKASLYEGGIRVPMIARWPGKIKSNSITDHPSAFWDVLPTITELMGIDAPQDIDGISFLPTLLQKQNQKTHDYLYWEYNGAQALRMGDWKTYRRRVNQPIELYNLVVDHVSIALGA